MSFETNNYIKFFKGYVLEEIHKELCKTNAYTKNEVDRLLKFHAQVEKSCAEMNYFEINELIVWSFIFGDAIGIFLDFKETE